MPSYTAGGTLRAPFGKNEFLASTKDVKTASYTLAADSVTAETIDGDSIKIVQPGLVLASITSGDDDGKVGPYAPGTPVAAVDEVQTMTIDATAGTYTFGFDGETTVLTFDDTAAAITTQLETMSNVDPGDIVVTGGPGDSGGTTPYVITFGGQYAGTDVPLCTAVDIDLTGGGDDASVVQTTAGAAATATSPATDGRQTPANIVGLNQTFLPWQLNERDVEVASVIECAAVQAWCLETNAAGATIPLTDATRDNIVAQAHLAILFR